MRAALCFHPNIMAGLAPSASSSPKVSGTTAVYDGFFHFLPIPDEIFHCPIYTTGAGCRVIHPGENYSSSLYPPLYYFKWSEGRTLPEFTFVLITAGKGIFESQPTGRVDIIPGTGFFLFPGIRHHYRPAPNIGWTELWVTFNGEFAHMLWDQKILSPERAVIHPEDSHPTKIALESLLSRIHGDPSSNSLLLSMRVIGILDKALGDVSEFSPALRTLSASKKMPSDPLVAAALEAIWTSTHRALSVDDVAHLIGVSRSTLTRRMASVHGRSVLEEINSCRFNRAERLLRETELPIKTVVSLAGFSSGGHMRRVFLSKTKLSPDQYRHSDMRR